MLRQVDKDEKPELKTPVRSLSNVRYDVKKGYFEIGRDKSSRTLTVNTAKTFAQTLKMMSLSKELVETSDFATKRDAYYQSKNWSDAKFDEQNESDTRWTTSRRCSPSTGSAASSCATSPTSTEGPSPAS